MAVVAWMAGVRAGAAYEHLRLALTPPTQTCPRCHGHGALRGGRPPSDRAHGPEERCPDCGGAGTVPTPAPALHLAAN